MDSKELERLKELKRQSGLSYDRALAKRNALEKAHSRMVVVYNEHIFRADAETINLVNTLKSSHDNFFVLDSNQNPVEIKDASEFLDILVARNQEALGAYHQLAKSFEKRDD
jgi:hypothetical protein